jgi:hypothetical protein
MARASPVRMVTVSGMTSPLPHLRPYRRFCVRASRHIGGARVSGSGMQPGSASEVIPFRHNHLDVVRVEHLAGVCGAEHSCRDIVVAQNCYQVPHSGDCLNSVPSEPADHVARP